MDTISKTLVFFGSGPIAAQSLDFLANHFKIEVVITKPAGSERRADNPVIKIAKKYSLKLFFAKEKNELSDIFKHWQPSSLAGIVIDYGIIIEQSIIKCFSHGIINSHFSLLPEWRGADPITYALLSGQIFTGACLMTVDNHLDEGDIIGSTTVTITSSDDNKSLSEKLIKASNYLLLAKLPDYLEGQCDYSSQQSISAVTTYSKKITKQDGLLDWSKPATVLEREIRAYQNWPSSHTKLGNIPVIIHRVRVITKQLAIGQLSLSVKGELLIGCRVGSLQLSEIQPHGKSSMNAKDFLNGYKKRLNFTT